MRFFLAMFTSSFRNFSYCSLMYFSMGSQLEEGGRKQMEVPEGHDLGAPLTRVRSQALTSISFPASRGL